MKKVKELKIALICPADFTVVLCCKWIIKILKSMGHKVVVIRKLHTNSGSNYNSNIYKKNEVIARRPCLYPWERVVLTAKGNLNFCPTDWFGKANICNYRETTIIEEAGHWVQQEAPEKTNQALHAFINSL